MPRGPGEDGVKTAISKCHQARPISRADTAGARGTDNNGQNARTVEATTHGAPRGTLEERHASTLQARHAAMQCCVLLVSLPLRIFA